VRFSYRRRRGVPGSLEDVAVLDNARRRRLLARCVFRAEPGELIALVGRPGPARRRSASWCAHLRARSAGRVLIGGHDVRDVTSSRCESESEWSARSAHVPRQHPGQPDLRSARCPRERAVGSRRAAQIADLVASCGRLDTVVGDRGYRLSGGEKQGWPSPGCCSRSPRSSSRRGTATLDSESEVAVQAALAQALTGRTSL